MSRGPTLLLTSTAAALALGLGGTAVVAGPLDAWAAWATAAVVGVAVGAATLPMLLPVAARAGDADADLLARLAGVALFAGVLRATLAAAGAILVVRLTDVAAGPTLGFVAAHYVLLTASEVGVLGRLFWLRDARAGRAAVSR